MNHSSLAPELKSKHLQCAMPSFYRRLGTAQAREAGRDAQSCRPVILGNGVTGRAGWLDGYRHLLQNKATGFSRQRLRTTPRSISMVPTPRTYPRSGEAVLECRRQMIRRQYRTLPIALFVWELHVRNEPSLLPRAASSQFAIPTLIAHRWFVSAPQCTTTH